MERTGARGMDVLDPSNHMWFDGLARPGPSLVEQLKLP
jgi:hypothetical protein